MGSLDEFSEDGTLPSNDPANPYADPSLAPEPGRPALNGSREALLANEGGPAEVCDGFDNDGDGAIDEETGGGDCATSDGRDGTLLCVRGELICQSCTAGETRELECPCGPNRIDLCDDTGHWQRGTCDGCSDETRPACERYGACTPNQVRVQRCDTCTGGGDCGVDCVGAQWLCSSECEWVQQTECNIYEEVQCGEDDVMVVACGRCGQQIIRCDGCFWTYEECEGEGVCSPGEQRLTACGDANCLPGYYATLECDATCEWEPPAACNGCAPGIHEEVEPCVVGAFCGERITRTVCSGEEVPICGGADTLVVGSARTEVIQECPEILCLPGQTLPGASCTTDLGECGTEKIECSNSCDWVTTCVANPEACIPGMVNETTFPCGANSCGTEYTVTDTCRLDGCGWDFLTGSTVDQCPACDAGEQLQQDCVTDLGECGTKTIACSADTCQWPTWESAACEPNPTACVPGEQQETIYSCGANRCGATYSVVTGACQADGCGWDNTIASTQDECPTCDAGQQYQESCLSDLGECGTRTFTCTSDTCEWQNSGCVPSSDSCVPGTTLGTTYSCGASMCGASYEVVTETCRSDGCGWLSTPYSTEDQCPVCQAGDSVAQSCVTAAGECGTRLTVCSADACEWTEQSCVPNEDACIPDTGRETTISCGSNTCGAEYTVTDTCRPDGCGWNLGSSSTQATCPECQAGQELSEACTTGAGECGTRASVCDSTTCDWTVGECAVKPQGCVPGETRVNTYPCGLNACGADYSVTDTCRADGCGWDEETSSTQVLCPECEAGDSYEEACTTDAGESGNRTIACSSDTCEWGPLTDCIPGINACVPGTIEVEEISCGSACDPSATYTITRTCKSCGCGWWQSQTGTCPCTPGSGKTYSCTTTDGQCGWRQETCSNTCTWEESSACIPRSYACVPGTERDTTYDCGVAACGAEYTVTDTCKSNGCGWNTGTSTTQATCPPCEAGEQYLEDCTTAGGQCGTQFVTCSDVACEWETSECVAQLEACSSGDTRQTTYSCGANACGTTYTITDTCQADGCGWTIGTENTVGQCPDCNAGESSEQYCVTTVGECGTQLTECDATTCSWNTYACEPNPSSCVPGSTRETSQSCGSTSCGREYVIRDTCRPDGCSWDLGTSTTQDTCPTCIAGEQREEMCTTSSGGCGTLINTCSVDTCEWSASGCLSGAESCEPGITRGSTYSCGPNMCGATYEVVTDTCRDDGCGWTPTPSSTQDSCPECEAGQVYQDPCVTASGACGTTTISCTTDTCAWVTSGCVASPGSCIPGTTLGDTYSCGANSCGATYMVISETCRSDGCGWLSTPSSTIGECPECQAGEEFSESCTTSAGECGTSTATCTTDTCEWQASACVAIAGSCVPDTTQTSTLSCGNNKCGAEYTVTETCQANGCGWNTTSSTIGTCPECEAGQEYVESCTTTAGGCGTRTTTCSSTVCTWSTSDCVPDATSCAPGAIRVETCSAVCGLPGSETWQCDTDGCGWTLQSSCTPLDPPTCTPGEIETLPCPGCMTTQQERHCSPDCSWNTWTDCPPCG